MPHESRYRQMAPTRPKTVRSLTSGPVASDLDIHASNHLTNWSGDDPCFQQAGRTTTHLAAHQSAQSLRKASKPSHRRGCSRSSSSPDLRKAPVIGIKAANFAQARRHKLHVPTISSPLNPAPKDSIEAIVYNGGNATKRPSLATSRDRLRSSSSASANAAVDSIIGPHIPAANGVLPSPLEPSQWRSSASLSKLSQPRSVQDLGSDYTRYYNPFATPTPSLQGLSSQASARQFANSDAGSVATADQRKRFSNPFADRKRLSSHSLDDAATLPTAEQHNIKQSASGLTLLAVPARADTPYFIRHADPEKAAFFQYVDDRLGAPQHSFPYFSDPVEDDDAMHLPSWDDDVKLKPRLREHFTRESIVRTLGLMIMCLGLLTIFVVLPAVSFSGYTFVNYLYDTPLDEMPGAWVPYDPWYHVDERIFPLMKNVRRGLIDADTPLSAITRRSVMGETLELVFSDEFNAQNRTFYHGDDPYWYGFEGWYGATQDLEWYDPDAINTGDGTLSLQMDQFSNHDLAYRSGMLNSWNQLCFKGGVFEVSVSLPGPTGVHGLWPGAWAMGNLARPGYLATSDGMWPYTYSECDAGITPNQSMTDGTSYLPGQRLPSCGCVGEDHPSPGKGRGAPEIDIAEVSADWSSLGIGVATQSYQVAPFDPWYRPAYDYMETPNPNISGVNSWTGGPFQQAVSTTTMLNNSWYDGIAYQKFAFEYQPGTSEDSFVAWTIGADEMMRFDARAVGPNGNVGQRIISEEPMSMILNLGISHNWVDIEFGNLRFPTIMRFDYVRIYQRKGEKSVTCDPPGFETTEYIAKHPAAYRNQNLTSWEDAGYRWPNNSLMHDCEAAKEKHYG